MKIYLTGKPVIQKTDRNEKRYAAELALYRSSSPVTGSLQADVTFFMPYPKDPQKKLAGVFHEKYPPVHKMLDFLFESLDENGICKSGQIGKCIVKKVYSFASGTQIKLEKL
ncbi:MAG: hypothetical protein KKH44_07800 [Bacteroidetes bacterium]|nr:hypothetical protein [Bacteroidota bacterium]